MTGALAFAIFSVTLGSFQFGYHIGCVNAPGEVCRCGALVIYRIANLNAFR